MSRWLFLLCLLCLIIALPVMAQDTPFELQGVVIGPGPSGEWDDRFTDPGAVVYHDGKFHMFRNGFRGWPASVQIGYLISEDGIIWEEVTEDPVLYSDDVPYAGLAALASGALLTDDATWMLYFYTWSSTAPWFAEGSIGLATADDPLGPWAVLEAPVLTAGPEAAWDGNTVNTPSVVQLGDGTYMMFYSGYNTDMPASIGMATSEDGIHWTKYDDPDTDGAYAESDPVFVVGEVAWDADGVHQPHVVQNADGQLVMVYRSQKPGRGNMRLGIATSQDGVEWQPYSDTPIFAPGDVTQNTNGFWFTALEYFEDTYYLYVESDGGQAGTRIFAYTYAGTFDEG